MPAECDEAALQERLYGGSAGARPSARREALDFAALHEQLRRKHLTLMLLRQEHREQHADGYRYSQFCELYREWKSRQEHQAGEKLFVDYAGQTVKIEDAATGQTREAVIFVATLGTSSYF